jgi:hypothetical protein
MINKGEQQCAEKREPYHQGMSEEEYREGMLWRNRCECQVKPARQAGAFLKFDNPYCRSRSVMFEDRAFSSATVVAMRCSPGESTAAIQPR